MQLGIDFKEIMQSLVTLPQTQRDVSTIAAAAQQAQNPQFQAQVQEGLTQIDAYAKTTLVLQALSTAALVGVFLLQVKASRKG